MVLHAEARISVLGNLTLTLLLLQRWEAAAEEHRREARELRAKLVAQDDALRKLEARACARGPPPPLPPAAAAGVRAGPSGRCWPATGTAERGPFS